MTDGSAIVCHGRDVEEGDRGRENGRESDCSITRPSVVSLSHRSDDKSRPSVVSPLPPQIFLLPGLARAAASSPPSPAADLRLSPELASSSPSPAADRTISPELAPSRIPLPLQRQIFEIFSPTLSPRTASEHARCPLPLRRSHSTCSDSAHPARLAITPPVSTPPIHCLLGDLDANYEKNSIVAIDVPLR
ncbi:hypothetical protein ACLOJK_010772 [Asimina triloba]